MSQAYEIHFELERRDDGVGRDALRWLEETYSVEGGYVARRLDAHGIQIIDAGRAPRAAVNLPHRSGQRHAKPIDSNTYGRSDWGFYQARHLRGELKSWDGISSAFDPFP